MKTINIAALVVSIIAIGISSFTLLNRDPMAEPVYGKDAKEIAAGMLSRPKWDGTSRFFNKHKREILRNLEVTNFLENNGVGLAFARTTASDKKLQFCLWMRKIDSGWEWVPYLSANISSDLRYKWAQKNREWLEEMEVKKNEWEKQSDSVW